MAQINLTDRDKERIREFLRVVGELEKTEPPMYADEGHDTMPTEEWLAWDRHSTEITDEYGDVYYENNYDVTRAENVTDNYAELLDCLVADKANESAETFFATNNYFYYFDAADDYYYDYSEHNVGTIVLYVYSDMATKAYNDKIAAMSWEQFKAFANSDDFYEGDVHGDCLDTYSIEILDGDTRTIDYLKAHGIEIG